MTTATWRLSQRKGAHLGQTAFLVGGMIALLRLCGLDPGQAVGSRDGLPRRAGPSNARAAPEVVLGRLGARPIGPLDGSPVYALLQSISLRAGLPRTPALYCIPTATLNAFALGEPDAAVVAVTEGLVRQLTLDELAGILAHEVAHIRNRDTTTMAFARDLTTATELMSLTGLILLELDARHGATRRAPGLAEAALLLCLAPALSWLLQLALSRLREFDADLDAVQLSGSAVGLARALQKLEHHHAGDGAAATAPLGAIGILLRSHPETVARVRSLLEIGIAGQAA
jgi:heat shock protein HtpX